MNLCNCYAMFLDFIIKLIISLEKETLVCRVLDIRPCVWVTLPLLIGHNEGNEFGMEAVAIYNKEL